MCYKAFQDAKYCSSLLRCAHCTLNAHVQHGVWSTTQSFAMCAHTAKCARTFDETSSITIPLVRIGKTLCIYSLARCCFTGCTHVVSMLYNATYVYNFGLDKKCVLLHCA